VPEPQLARIQPWHIFLKFPGHLISLKSHSFNVRRFRSLI
jgi:hypothetical protein